MTSRRANSIRWQWSIKIVCFVYGCTPLSTVAAPIHECPTHPWLFCGKLVKFGYDVLQAAAGEQAHLLVAHGGLYWSAWVAGGRKHNKQERTLSSHPSPYLKGKQPNWNLFKLNANLVTMTTAHKGPLVETNCSLFWFTSILISIAFHLVFTTYPK